MSDSTGMLRVRQALLRARARAQSEKVRVVMGNEAADLDSMVSAVMFAWYLGERDDALASLPLIPIPHEDFRLRTEALYLFDAAGLPESELVFAEDLDLAALHAAGRLDLVLVDHNRLGKAFAAFADAVSAIVDHHADERLFPHAQQTIEGVGSCATLVAESILRDLPQALPADGARLLLGTILLDTVNLDEQAGRVTIKDRETAQRLIAVCRDEPDGLFQRVQFEKFNVAALDTADLLRKDYKDYRAGSINYGVSSVLLPIADWTQKDPGLVAGLDDYSRRRGLDVLIAMNAYTAPHFCRELVVFSRSAEQQRKLVTFLCASDLGLVPLTAGTPAASAQVAFFRQHNESYSRKKLQPVLDSFFRETSNS